MISQDSHSLPQPYHCAWKEYTHDPIALINRYGHTLGEIIPLQFDGEAEPVYLMTHPDHIAYVLKNRLLFIRDSTDLHMLIRLLGNGLIATEGEFWQQQRRLLQPFFQPKAIHDYGETIVRHVQEMLLTWPESEEFNIHTEMMNLAFNVIVKNLLNQDTVADPIRHLAHLLANRLYQEVQSLMDQVIYGEIQIRRAQGTNSQDLLGLLMSIQAADGEGAMSDRQIRDEVVTLIMTGHETTANALAWTWLELGKHPHVYDKLILEIQTVLGGNPPTVADLPKLTYTNNIIREVLRLYPAIQNMFRRAVQDCDLGGYKIPKHTMLMASQWINHRDRQYFPEPDVFNPDRWANDLEKRLPAGGYFPFGYGPRTCIGKNLALMEIGLALATISQQFRVELVPNQTIKMKAGFTLYPKNGIQVTLKKI